MHLVHPAEALVHGPARVAIAADPWSHPQGPADCAGKGGRGGDFREADPQRLDGIVQREGGGDRRRKEHLPVDALAPCIPSRVYDLTGLVSYRSDSGSGT